MTHPTSEEVPHEVLSTKPQIFERLRQYCCAEAVIKRQVEHCRPIDQCLPPSTLPPVLLRMVASTAVQSTRDQVSAVLISAQMVLGSCNIYSHFLKPESFLCSFGGVIRWRCITAASRSA